MGDDRICAGLIRRFNRDVSLVQGIVTFAVLASLQFIVSWASVRSSWLQQLSRSQP